MENYYRRSGDTLRKRRVIVSKGSVGTILFVLVAGMLCFAYSREQDDVYQDPYADPNEKIGQQVSEKVEPAEQHGGRFSVQSYEFTGKGPAHKMSDVKKYDLDHTGSRGSKISVKVHIEWPEVLSGSRRELQTGDVIELVGRTSGKKAMRIVFLSEGTLSAEEVELQDILLAGWKKFSPEIDITQFVLKTQWDSNRIFACRRDARYNHPEIFYYDGSGSIRRTISPSGSLLACKLVGLKYDFPASELDARTHELDAAVAKAMATVEGVSDDAEKALRLHDYIIKVCDYDDVAAKGKDSSCLARTVYSVLVRGRAVCEGYTMAYRHLLNAVGIISEETVGNDGRHVWNYVRISGRWYHVDVTWDDTLHSGYDRTSGFISRRNFLMSDNRTRETGHKGWDVHGLPPADDNSYDLRFQC